MRLPLILVGSLVTAPAAAQTVTGNELFNLCQSNAANCNWYIVGVFDGVTSLGMQGLSTAYCAPKGATKQQGYDIVKRALANTPELRHLDAPTFAIAALGIAWPCQKP